ncbi:WD40 repeat domain-containing protein [Gimesia sp.]|uniref:WD40 repeat domain-containing protein n=1 Tax=Gimesia sp. TaxID=2024833 RepID=UPI0032EE3461
MRFHWMMILLLGGLSAQLVLGAEPVSGKTKHSYAIVSELKIPRKQYPQALVIRFSEDNRRITVVTVEGVYVYDLDRSRWGAKSITFLQYADRAVISGDGSILLCAHDHGKATLWDLTRLELIWSFDTGNKLLGPCALSADGETLALLKQGTVYLGQIRDKTFKHLWKPAEKDVRAIRFIPGKTTQLVGFARKVKTQEEGGGVSWDHDVYLWREQLDGTYSRRKIRESTSEKRTIDSFTLTGEDLTPIQFSHDAQLLGINEGEGIEIWELNQAKKLHTIQPTETFVGSISFSGDNRLLATGGGFLVLPPSTSLKKNALPQPVKSIPLKGKLSVWEISTGKRLAEIELGIPVGTIDLADKTGMLAASTHGTLILLKPDAGR